MKRLEVAENISSLSLAEKLAYELDPKFHKMPHETLSDREYQVMRMIASGKTVKEKEIGFVGG